LQAAKYLNVDPEWLIDRPKMWVSIGIELGQAERAAEAELQRRANKKPSAPGKK